MTQTTVGLQEEREVRIEEYLIEDNQEDTMEIEEKEMPPKQHLGDSEENMYEPIMNENGIENNQKIDSELDKRPIQEINSFLIILPDKQKKLPDEIKQKIKDLYQCRWNDEKKSFSGPQKNKILVEAFLTNNKINFTLEDDYNQYFDLNPNQQQQERLSDAKRFKESKALKMLGYFTTILLDYNKIYGTNVKKSDFNNDKLINLQEFEHGKQKQHFEELIKEYQKIVPYIQESRKIGEKIQKIGSQKNKDKKPTGNFENDSEDAIEVDKAMIQARASARRRALMNYSTAEEIANDICKQYPKLSEQSEDIATKALLWAESYQANCEVIVGGIPKTITDMKSLDSRFAQLEAPGQPCVTIHRSDAQPISNIDFNKRLSGEVVLSGVDEKGQAKYLPASTFWIGNTHKKIYRRIVFTNQKVSDDTYNLFTGFGIDPRNGNCEKILNHIKEVICSGDEINNSAFIKLLA